MIPKYEDPWPTSTEKIKEIAQWFANGDEYLAVSLKEPGKVIGFIAINRRKEREEPVHNLGYVFNPEFNGQGFATESCLACMDYVFDELKAVSIVTGTHPDNESSVRLLTRLGLKAIDNGEYTILREEWLTK